MTIPSTLRRALTAAFAMLPLACSQSAPSAAPPIELGDAGEAPRVRTLLRILAADSMEGNGRERYRDVEAARLCGIIGVGKLLTQAWEQTIAPDMGGLRTLCGLALGEAQVRAGRLGVPTLLPLAIVEATSVPNSPPKPVRTPKAKVSICLASVS